MAAVLAALALLASPARPRARMRLGALAGLPAPARDRGRIRAERLPPAEALGLAASWDLLSACLRAGMPVADAMRSIADGLPREAAEALRRTSELLALGADPCDAWRPSLACPATAALAKAARRTARSGTALADVATELAARARAELSEAADARSQRVGVLIAGPLGLCFLPGFFCLGVLPVVIGLAEQVTVMR